MSHVVVLEDPTPTVTTQGLSTIFSCKFVFATLCCIGCIGVYNLFTIYFVGIRQENWETRCGYVYEMTIRLKDHADQLWCVVPIYTTTLDQRYSLSCVDYRCSADPMIFNVGPASATSDQYCIGIGSTHRGSAISAARRIGHCNTRLRIVVAGLT